MRVLMAYESGSGRGHYVRLADLAYLLRLRGIDTVLVTYRLDDVEPFADAFDAIAQAPVWPLFFKEKHRPLHRSTPTLAAVLANLGLAEPRFVTANQRSWAGLLDYWRPNLVIADFAPGAILAAKGRCPSLQVGVPFYTPALDGDVFPAFLPQLKGVGMLEPQLLSAIGEAMEKLKRPVPATLADAIVGDESMPTSFAEFDPYGAFRREPLLPPELTAPADLERGRGDGVYFYLPEWMQANTDLMKVLCALNRPTKLFLPNIGEGLRTALVKHGVDVRDRPFSLQELAAAARIFIHKGGGGSSHLGLIAGVPQIALVTDMESAVNGNALVGLKVGATLDYRRLTSQKLVETVNRAFGSEDLQDRGADVAIEMRARLPEQPVIETMADRIMASMAV